MTYKPAFLFAPPGAHLPTSVAHAAESHAFGHPLARPLLAHALLLGVAADAIVTWRLGLGFALWIALCATTLVALTWRADRELSRETGGWLGAALLFGLFLVWRASSSLDALDVLAALGALTMAALSIADASGALFADRLRDQIRGLWRIWTGTMLGMIPLVLRDLRPLPGDRATPSRTTRLLRPVAIAAVLTLLFGSLLRGADPVFASLSELPDLDIASTVSHLFCIGAFTWLAAGWARSALIAEQTGSAAGPLPFTLERNDITAALGTLIVLFAAFVLVQLGWLFGGEQFLQSRVHLSAAEYARSGFFELVWVAILVIPVLVTTRAALRPGRALARRHAALSLPVIGLVGAIIVSAALRMRMYVRYYGLTPDRLETLVFMGWLALVLGWLAWTMLRRRDHQFVAGTIVSGAITLAALNVMAPEAIVARVNVARASHLAVDLEYLSWLSGDATPIAVAATLAPAGELHTSDADQRCRAARILLNRWGDDSQFAGTSREAGGWRSWNAGEAAAAAAVADHYRELRTLAHSCRRST